MVVQWLRLCAPNAGVRWLDGFNGYEFEQALEDGDGQGSLASCRPWGRKELDTTE